jgi:hypothetical protein
LNVSGKSLITLAANQATERQAKYEANNYLLKRKKHSNNQSGKVRKRRINCFVLINCYIFPTVQIGETAKQATLYQSALRSIIIADGTGEGIRPGRLNKRKFKQFVSKEICLKLAKKGRNLRDDHSKSR